MKHTITLLLVLMAMASTAQEIRGRIIDETKQGIINAGVMVFQNKILKGGNVTDYDGNYVIKPLESGTYDLLVTYIGYDSLWVLGVPVSPDGSTTINKEMKKTKTGKLMKEIVVTAYKMPIISDNPGKTSFSRADIAKLPTTTVYDIASQAAGTYQTGRGNGLSIGGGRGEGTVYIIDGVVVRGVSGAQMAQGSIDNLNVVTSGIPGNYGDAQPPFVNSAAPQPPSTAEYKRTPENPFKLVTDYPLSTMSVDVDRASYSNMRRFINEGQLPPRDAVRIEEFINYFDYDYAQPTDNEPVAIHTELTTCPWNEENQLLHIGIQAVKLNTDDLPPSNLVFLIDVSGSMSSEERLPLLVEGMKLLVYKLRAKDKVSIVTYAGNAGLVLPPTQGNNKDIIIAALDNLTASGSTAGGAGIALAYKIAKENFISGGNNRVLLATDGDFNVGISSEGDLEDLITKERKSGIFLTCLGFGTDNYKDAKMELLADKGNGNYSYIDNIKEAEKTLVNEFGGTLFTVAKDVKSQIEFNPAKVQGYRLIGYENRMLNTEDFKNDKKDAGDMGSGHTVTIIYEIIPAGIKSKYLKQSDNLKYTETTTTRATENNELATIKFRYKKPDGETSKEIEKAITYNTINWHNATENTRFSYSVAMFGMLLGDSMYSGTSNFDVVKELAGNSMKFDTDGYRAEFLKLVGSAEQLK